MNKFVKAAAVAAGSLALFGAATGAAQASPVAATATGLPPVPSCVTLYSPFNPFGGNETFSVTNNCSRTVNVKTVLAMGTTVDTCYAVNPGQTITENYYAFGTYMVVTGLTTC
ncbi:hypothetical protein [Kitasatospora sp. NPDC058190]|uniref:hypothetical protein n=1 Tax=Kitasatospora sp. NPDC058190 TaxID=3346371 RepID=UPI0036DC1E42